MMQDPSCSPRAHYTPQGSLDRRGSFNKMGSMLSSLGESQLTGGYTPGMRGSFVGDRGSFAGDRGNQLGGPGVWGSQLGGPGDHVSFKGEAEYLVHAAVPDMHRQSEGSSPPKRPVSAAVF